MVETGLGGVRGLEEFYQTRIVDYRKRLEDQCTTLREEYSKMVRLKGKGFLFLLLLGVLILRLTQRQPRRPEV